MTRLDHLVEQHVQAYEARLRHIDELLERADRGAGALAGESPERQELEALRRRRERLAALVASYRRRAREGTEREALEHLGPMIVWEEVARRLEALVERLGGEAGRREA